MKTRPALLATLATALLLGGAALLASFPGPGRERIEPHARDVAASSTEPARRTAQSTAPTPPLQQEVETDTRTSLVDGPAEGGGNEEQLSPPTRFGLILRRWPDGAALAGRKADIFGRPRLALTERKSDGAGFIGLDLDPTKLPFELNIRAQGFEPNEALVDTSTPRPEVFLRPELGWYGRVLSKDGTPVAGVRVSGWWIEAARPFHDESDQDLTDRERLKIHLEALGYSVDSRLLARGVYDRLIDKIPEEPSHFVNGKGLVQGTAATNAEGYYYIEELQAAVNGELVLLAPDVQGLSSDVLREAIPRATPLLPDLILHRSRQLRGQVVDGLGDPVADAVVIPRLARGWSAELPTVRTDEAGVFALDQPVEPIQLSVEKIGYHLSSDTLGPRESADSMWRSVSSIVDKHGYTMDLFNQAYARWSTDALPRARPVLAVDPHASDIRIQLEGPGNLYLFVRDPAALPGGDLGIRDARVRVSYGGLDNQTLSLLTDAAGRTTAPMADVDWQPVIVHVEADGYMPSTQILRRGMAQLDFPMMRSRARRTPYKTSMGPPLLVGQVAGLGPDEVAQVVVYPEQRATSTRRPLWSGATDGLGRFEIEKGGPRRPGEAFFIYAFVDVAANRRGGVAGPVLQNTEDVVTVSLENSVTVAIHLGRFDVDTPHRIQVQLAPIPGVETAMSQRVDLREASTWSSEHPVSVPYGWEVEATVERLMEGNVPIIDFVREDPKQTQFKSLDGSWTDWVAASETASLKFAHGGAHLMVHPPDVVDLTGSVTDLPIDAPALRVAAIGKQGHWTRPVSSLGWFDFQGLPSGSYRLLLYSPPDAGDGIRLDDEGAILGSIEVDADRPRHDLVLPWKPVEED